MSYILQYVCAFFSMHLSLKSLNYILHFTFYILCLCIFCLYIFCLWRSIFLNSMTTFYIVFVHVCVHIVFVHFVLHFIESLQFLFWVLGVTYVWRFIIGDLKFFTFSLKNSCMGGLKYHTNIIKLQKKNSNFNPFNINFC